jgi:hypothetical protein
MCAAGNTHYVHCEEYPVHELSSSAVQNCEMLPRFPGLAFGNTYLLFSFLPRGVVQGQVVWLAGVPGSHLPEGEATESLQYLPANV